MACGIGGISTYEPFGEEEAVMAHRLLSSLTRRGEDAWGYFDGFHVWKEPGSFFVSSKYDTLVDDLLAARTNLFLCHTRLATVGDPKRNYNNHPLWLESLVFAHNGMLFYTDEFINPTNIETDSFWMLYWINEEYKKYHDIIMGIREGVQHVSGNYAVWLYNRDNRLAYLFRNEERLVGTVYLPQEKRLIFGSDALSLADALGVPKGLRKKWYMKKLYHSITPGRIYQIGDGAIADVGWFKPTLVRRVWEWRFWRFHGHLAKYHEEGF